MRSYQADLSRRLDSVFAEQAAQPKTASTRNLPVEVPRVVVPRVVVPLSAAYKPTHGGYPSAGAPSMSEHKDAVYFDEIQPADSKTKAAYRELRLWQKGYLAAVEGGHPNPRRAADDFACAVNEKRAQLLA